MQCTCADKNNSTGIAYTYVQSQTSIFSEQEDYCDRRLAVTKVEALYMKWSWSFVCVEAFWSLRKIAQHLQVCPAQQNKIAQLEERRFANWSSSQEGMRKIGWWVIQRTTVKRLYHEKIRNMKCFTISFYFLFECFLFFEYWAISQILQHEILGRLVTCTVMLMYSDVNVQWC